MDEIELNNLQFLEKITGIADKANSEITNKRSVDSADEDFFVAHFLERMTRYADSIIYLAKKEFYHESVLVSRNLLEGLIYFSAFLKNKKMATDWRYFGIYEDCEKAYKKAGEEALNNLVSEMKIKFGQGKIEELERKYNNFAKIKNGKFKKWHNKKSINELINDDHNLQSLYDQLYSDFSKITHWTPSGVIGGKGSFRSAVCVAFQCIFEALRVINDNYSLSYGEDLGNVYNEFLEFNSEKIARS